MYVIIVRRKRLNLSCKPFIFIESKVPVPSTPSLSTLLNRLLGVENVQRFLLLDWSSLMVSLIFFVLSIKPSLVINPKKIL